MSRNSIWSPAGRDGKDTESAVTGDERGDPLEEGSSTQGFALARQERKKIGMRVNVDESGSNDQTCGVDGLRGIHSCVGSHAGNPSVLDQHIGRERISPGPVDNQSVANHVASSRPAAHRVNVFL